MAVKIRVEYDADVENIDELREFLAIFDYSNSWGYNCNISFKNAVKDLKKFLDKQLKDFED